MAKPCLRTARESGLNSLANEQLERTKEETSSVRTRMRKGITMEAIKTVGLSKLYGKKRAVDNLSFTIGSGEIYGFVGRNGAGKSTVMKMLAGLILPSSGEIEILGEKMAPGCTSRRLGALIENPGIHLGLSGLDNAMVRALALGVPNAKAMSLDVLRIVGLENVAQKRAKTYSLGMKQRLGLALALVGSPDLLLLDEPFNGLDPQAVRELRTTIIDLAQMRNITVFISSHVLDQLERMVTRYGVIRDGVLVREMAAEEVDAECADYLSIRVAEPQVALAKLQDAFPQAKFAILPDNSIRADITSKQTTCSANEQTRSHGNLDPNQVGYVLSQAGIPVTELYIHERDIEELFVGLMGADSFIPGSVGVAQSEIASPGAVSPGAANPKTASFEPVHSDQVNTNGQNGNGGGRHV